MFIDNILPNVDLNYVQTKIFNRLPSNFDHRASTNWYVQNLIKMLRKDVFHFVLVLPHDTFTPF